eukprot:augustus_masked-scaffold_4-processed-gene-10.44-mRNA-1 protein AED:1.00 eAED:1.00 QI:0/-1/0/0/-1/1/1/0/337
MSALKKALSKLDELQQPEYGTLDGIHGYSKLLESVKGDDCYTFSSKWLEKLKQVENEWDEDHLIRFLYIAKDFVQSSIKHRNEPRNAFEKVLPEASKIFSLRMFRKKNSVQKIYSILRNEETYDPVFIDKLNSILMSNPNSHTENQTKKDEEEESMTASAPPDILSSDDESDFGDMVQKPAVKKKKKVDLGALLVILEKSLNLEIELKKLDISAENYEKICVLKALMKAKREILKVFQSSLEAFSEDEGNKLGHKEEKMEELVKKSTDVDTYMTEFGATLHEEITEERYILKRKRSDEIGIATDKKEEEELQLVWDKFTKSYIPAPKIGDIEDWRER